MFGNKLIAVQRNNIYCHRAIVTKRRKIYTKYVHIKLTHLFRILIIFLLPIGIAFANVRITEESEKGKLNELNKKIASIKDEIDRNINQKKYMNSSLQDNIKQLELIKKRIIDGISTKNIKEQEIEKTNRKEKVINSIHKDISTRLQNVELDIYKQYASIKNHIRNPNSINLVHLVSLSKNVQKQLDSYKNIEYKLEEKEKTLNKEKVNAISKIEEMKKKHENISNSVTDTKQKIENIELETNKKNKQLEQMIVDKQKLERIIFILIQDAERRKKQRESMLHILHIKKHEREKKNEELIDKTVSFIWPISGSIIPIVKFGSRISSSQFTLNGMCIKAFDNQTVRAIGGGIVVYTGQLGSYNNIIIIDHENGYVSIYGNNKSIYVSKGTKIKQGKKISSVYDTYLYFSIRHNGESINPNLICH